MFEWVLNTPLKFPLKNQLTEGGLQQKRLKTKKIQSPVKLESLIEETL